MSEFKAGDRVRITSGTWRNGRHVGSFGTVRTALGRVRAYTVAVDADNGTDDAGFGWYYAGYQLEAAPASSLEDYMAEYRPTAAQRERWTHAAYAAQILGSATTPTAVSRLAEYLMTGRVPS